MSTSEEGSPSWLGGKVPHEGERVPAEEYPRCPRCGGPVVGAMMTSGCRTVGVVTYYRARVVSVYCPSGDCNYDQPLANLKFPVTK